MKRLIFTFLFVFFTSALTLPSPIPPNPPTPNPTKTTPSTPIVETNETKYQMFMSQTNKITNEANSILKSLQTTFAKKYVEFAKDIEEHKSGLETIRNFLTNHKLYISEKEKQCPKLKSLLKQELGRYINFTQSKHKLIVKTINETMQLKQLANLTLHMVQLSDNYLNLLKTTLLGSFCSLPEARKLGNVPIPKKQYYKNNLEVSNWYYGSTNQAKYKAYLLKIGAAHNLTTCPFALPFVKEKQQKCFNCPKYSIYNLGSQKCETCKPGEMFNVAKGVCQPCYGQVFIVKHQFMCKACALQAEQLFDPVKGKCYKCKANEYLDGTTRSCKPIKCPPNQPKFNRELALCESCPADQVINPENPQKCLPKCSGEKPIYNTKANLCQECPKQTRYVVQTKKCQKMAKTDTVDSIDSQNSNQSGQQSTNGGNHKERLNLHSVLFQVLPPQEQPNLKIAAAASIKQ